MILRDHHGAMIFASCRFIQRCSSALEAEVGACMEGVALALEWSTKSLVAETDCTTAARMISDPTANRSLVAAMVGETRQLLAGRQHEI